LLAGHLMRPQPPRMPRAPRTLGRNPMMPRSIRPPRSGMGFAMPTARSSPAAAEFGQAIADQLFASLQPKITLDLPVEAPAIDTDDLGEDVRPTVGSVL